MSTKSRVTTIEGRPGVVGGVSLADLLGGRADLEIPFGDKALQVVYDPREVRSNMIDERQGQEALAKALERVLLAWDLVDAHGNPWGLTLADLMDVPFAVAIRVLKAIVGDQQVDPQ